MDDETLERLMLDRGLGALPTDCDTLLEAYLETRPDAAAACQRIEETICSARIALTQAPAERPPEFPAERLLRAQRGNRTWNIARRITGIAAAIALGFAAHALWFHRAPSLSQPRDLLVAAHVGSEPGPPGSSDEAGFWSARRLYQRAAGARQQTGKNLIWHSPVSFPQLGDAT